MIKRFLAALVVLATAVLGPAAVATAAPASAAVENCTLSVVTPYWSDSYMWSSATVNCEYVAPSNRLEVRMWMLEDGYYVNYNGNLCGYGTLSCVTTVKAPNHAGNQLWCGYAEAYMGGNLIKAKEVCESTGY